jgi:hypothetical protein
MKSIFDAKPVLGYLDHLYYTSKSLVSELVESNIKIAVKSLGLTWSK